MLMFTQCKETVARAPLPEQPSKNKAIGVWARSTKALVCELWAEVSLSAQGVIPPARCSASPRRMLSPAQRSPTGTCHVT